MKWITRENVGLSDHDVLAREFIVDALYAECRKRAVT